MKLSILSTLCKIWQNTVVRIQTARIDFLFFTTFRFKITYGGRWGSLSFNFSHRQVKISPGGYKNIPLRRILRLAKLNCWIINKRLDWDLMLLCSWLWQDAWPVSFLPTLFIHTKQTNLCALDSFCMQLVRFPQQQTGTVTRGWLNVVADATTCVSGSKCVICRKTVFKGIIAMMVQFLRSVVCRKAKKEKRNPHSCLPHHREWRRLFSYLVAHVWSALLHLVSTWLGTCLREPQMITAQRNNGLWPQFAASDELSLGSAAFLQSDAQSTSPRSIPTHFPLYHRGQSH